MTSLWEGNVGGCVVCVLETVCDLIFGGALKKLFPVCEEDVEFMIFPSNHIAPGSLLNDVANTLVYSLVCLRAVLGADLQRGECEIPCGPLVSGLVQSTFFLRFLVYAGSVFGS